MSLGIENLKTALAGAIELGNAIDKALADDKFNFSDAPLFMSAFPAIAAAIKSAREAGKEIGDVDQFEREELKTFIKDRFDLTDDILEARLESGIDALQKIAEAIFVSVSTARIFFKKD